MKLAILSDIHGNLEALESVVAHAKSEDVTHFVNLGDTVGYGANPVECFEWVNDNCSVKRMGNHELMLLATLRIEKYENMPSSMEMIRMMGWTAKQFVDQKELVDSIKSLAANNDTIDLRGTYFAHGTPYSPNEVDEYLLVPGMKEDLKMSTLHNLGRRLPLHDDLARDAFQRIEKIAFVGHVHVPYILFETPMNQKVVASYGVENQTTKLSDQKMIVCVGSVGQPRDENPEACYVTFDGSSIKFHRVEYGIKKAQEKILSNEGFLAEEYATRLSHGR